MDILTSAKNAKTAAIKLAAVEATIKNQALKAIAEKLATDKKKILEANEKDLVNSGEMNIPTPLIKRLKFDAKKISDTIDGIYSLINLPDPVGVTLTARELDKELNLYQISCPIGVIGVIFESRPDALVQISTLCLKSGNAVLLKGGSEAANTNRVLADIIAEATEAVGIPNSWLHLLETREDVNDMLKMDEYIDLLIPRGSNAFVKYIMDHSNIPVMGHADGICHVFVDSDVDQKMALNIVIDSKCQYVAVCNALETLLVHEAVAQEFLPSLKEKMIHLGVKLLGCPRTTSIIDIAPATEKDWKTEYLDLILSVKVVATVEEAIDHINLYGSGHTDAIVTQNPDTANKFMSLVDSGNVLWNCSTRFSDGFRYGLGAEVGISTGKIHARGPVGLEGLVIYKWILKGSGQIVAPYADGTRSFTHHKLS
jgi:glutamate-5-semialdehyde dehydrogenase